LKVYSIRFPQKRGAMALLGQGGVRKGRMIRGKSSPEREKKRHWMTNLLEKEKRGGAIDIESTVQPRGAYCRKRVRSRKTE